MSHVNRDLKLAQHMSIYYSDFSNNINMIKGICYDIFKDDNLDVEFNEYSLSLKITLRKEIFEQKTYNDLSRLWDLGFKRVTLIEKKYTTFTKEFQNDEEKECY